MFTGIVEELGQVHAITPADGGARLEIEASKVLDDAEIGRRRSRSTAAVSRSSRSATVGGQPTR